MSSVRHQFKLKHHFKPAGDQPQAIKILGDRLKDQDQALTLLGVTGSGKTYTVANVIAELQRPTLVIAPNKTLAAQLVSEFRTFFPDSAVEYFVSYYDYYQPEAYLPGTDTYIEKEADINNEIDRLRHAATAAVLSRRDCIVVATVSCIYGLGSPTAYQEQHLVMSVGDDYDQRVLIRKLVSIHYTRSPVLKRGTFRVRGNVIEIMPPDRERVIRVELEDSHITHLVESDPFTREKIAAYRYLELFPAKHFVVDKAQMDRAIQAIEDELQEQLKFFERVGKLLEAERLERRTKQDIEMLREVGYCSGIENYSRHIAERDAGSPPETLIDFFPKDFLLVIDESHVTVPQLHGMYAGDRSRKETLVEFGFRLPSAKDNRPLTFDEFLGKIGQRVFVSATPGPYELAESAHIVEQIVRPTGLVDPAIEIRPAAGQIQDLIEEIERVVAKKERVLVTTLTKKQAEDLANYLKERHVRADYLHSEVDTVGRIEVLVKLRKGEIDVLVGVNLLREGLDLPEVSLVGILDADQEGFLRSQTALIQTMGRAARHIHGKVILYASRESEAMGRAVAEADRRRTIQVAYNKTHGITPRSIEKAIESIIDHELKPEVMPKEFATTIEVEDIPRLIRTKKQEMATLAKDLKFEEAALVRDEIIELKRLLRS